MAAAVGVTEVPDSEDGVISSPPGIASNATDDEPDSCDTLRDAPQEAACTHQASTENASFAATSSNESLSFDRQKAILATASSGDIQSTNSQSNTIAQQADGISSGQSREPSPTKTLTLRRSTEENESPTSAAAIEHHVSAHVGCESDGCGPRIQGMEDADDQYKRSMDQEGEDTTEQAKVAEPENGNVMAPLCTLDPGHEQVPQQPNENTRVDMQRTISKQQVARSADSESEIESLCQDSSVDTSNGPVRLDPTPGLTEDDTTVTTATQPTPVREGSILPESAPRYESGSGTELVGEAASILQLGDPSSNGEMVVAGREKPNIITTRNETHSDLGCPSRPLASTASCNSPARIGPEAEDRSKYMERQVELPSRDLLCDASTKEEQIPIPTPPRSGGQQTQLATPTIAQKPAAKSAQETTLAELRAQRATLIASLAALPNVRDLVVEQHLQASENPDGEPTDAAVTAAAGKLVKSHIKLLHEYNEIKDVGQGLMGLIADQRGVRIVEVQDEFGLDSND